MPVMGETAAVVGVAHVQAVAECASSPSARRLTHADDTARLMLVTHYAGTQFGEGLCH